MTTNVNSILRTFTYVSNAKLISFQYFLGTIFLMFLCLQTSYIDLYLVLNSGSIMELD